MCLLSMLPNCISTGLTGRAGPSHFTKRAGPKKAGSWAPLIRILQSNKKSADGIFCEFLNRDRARGLKNLCFLVIFLLDIQHISSLKNKFWGYLLDILRLILRNLSNEIFRNIFLKFLMRGNPNKRILKY